jgi:hypothetical protein
MARGAPRAGDWSDERTMTEAPQTRLFDRLAAHFAILAAERSDLARVEDYRLGRDHVRFRFIGLDLAARIDAAFAHLRLAPAAAAAQPDLEVALWDEAAAGRATPDGDLGEPEMEIMRHAQGNLIRARHGTLHAHWTAAGSTMLDLASGRAYGWIDDAAGLTLLQAAKPLQHLLFRWFVSRGVLPVHSAAVAHGDVGLLLCGPGGSGKSTSSLAASLAGMSFLGDDYMLLAEDAAGGFVAHSIYAAAWLDPDHSRRLPAVAAQPLGGAIGEERKRPFDTARALRGRLAPSMRVSALLLPRVGVGSATVWRPAGKGETLRRLATDAVLRGQWFAPPRWAMATLTRLVAAVPCYWLELGSDIEQVGRALADGFKPPEAGTCQLSD